LLYNEDFGHTTPWGAGEYGFYGGGWVFNNGWHGGEVWSGSQWLAF
jgi:hypothetical protein